MNFDEVVKARRSMRTYKESDKLTTEKLEELFKLVQFAPSWKNSQTGRYYVAASKEMFEKVHACLPEFNQKNSNNAAALVVETFVTKRSGFNPDGTPTNDGGDLWGAYDLGLASSILCLKAKEMGFDTLIMGIRDEKALRDLFNIPETEQIMAVISIGEGDANPTMPARKDLEAVAKFM